MVTFFIDIDEKPRENHCDDFDEGYGSFSVSGNKTIIIVVEVVVAAVAAAGVVVQ